MIYICSLAHGSGEPPKELITDDPILADRFAEAEDGRPGRGIYQALNPLIPGAQRRCLETVAAIQFIYFDLDIQNIDATREQILDWLRQLPIEFVWVRDSGSGNIHAGIEIKDAPPPGPEYDRVVAVWKRLAEKFAADPAPVHPAALIRRVGTHNKKNGSNGLCHELWNGGRPVDITELEALDELLVEPLLTRKQVEQSGVTNVPPETRPPVDVDERLSRMQWRGPGDSSIHSTQLSVSAAMLRQGISLNEMVQVVLSATRGVGDPSWNWGEEERTIRRMGIDLINKDPEGLADRLPEDLRQKVIDILANGRRPKITYTLNLGWHVRAEREGTKTSIVRDLLIKGTTIQEILEATGWPTVSVPQMARNAGLQLTKWTEGDTTWYRGTPLGEEAGAYVYTEQTRTNGNSPPSPNEPPPKGPRFKLIRYCDLRPGMGDQDYLVDELLPTEGLVVVWGKFKCLKTFWVFDLMLHIAKGWEYRDRAVRQGLVIYCAFEGAHGFGKRTEAQRKHYNLPDDDDVPLRVMPCQMNLVTQHKNFVADIRGQLEDGESPAVVVLDTLNRSLVGSESKDADMSAYIAAASAIREAFKCLVIIVHHCGWDETRPRGHSSLSAAIEGQLAVSRHEDHITVLIEFLRDGPEGGEIHSVTRVIEVGIDANGKTVTSLAVAPSDDTAPGARGWPRKLTVFRRAMKTALANYGEDFQENILEPPVRAVVVEEIRKEFFAVYSPAKGETPEQRREAKRRQFDRYIESAQSEGLIRVREPEGQPAMAWFPNRSAQGGRTMPRFPAMQKRPSDNGNFIQNCPGLSGLSGCCPGNCPD